MAISKLLYVANIRFPTERAHGIQIAEMCDAFASLGAEVELVVQRRVNVLEEDVFTYYNIPRSFRITELRTIDTLQYAWTGILGRLSYTMQTFVYALNALRYALKTPGFIYSRDEFPLFLLSFFGRPFVYEVHAPKRSFIVRRVIRKAALILPISHGLESYYLKQGVPDEKILVAPDAVNLSRFTIKETREECRKRLSLPEDKKIVLYAGHLYERKGAFVVGDAAPLCDDNTIVLFVGGTEDEIPEFTERYGKDAHVRILGPKPYADIPYYLRAADVLVLPNSAKDADARIYTSPMKLFEYMASGTPIIASDVPSLREILDENSAYLFNPDDSQALAKSIMYVLTHTGEAYGKAHASKARVSEYSWVSRARNILGAIERVTSPGK